MASTFTRRSFIGSAAAASTMFLAACGGGSGDAGGAGDDKRLGVMLGTNVMSLDPAKATDGDSFEVMADCIDGLLQMDADGKPAMAIASSYDVSDDEKTYTFTLRDAKWSNGKPVTAEDFVYAWRRICLECEEYAYMMSDIAQIKGAAALVDKKETDATTLGVTAPDEKTLVVELEVPVSFFPSLMYFPVFFPLNEEFVKSCGDSFGTSPDTYLSNGAFVLDDYLPGTASLSLKKNPDYWNAEKVTLGGINYQVVGSSDNALTAFKNKSLDVVMINGEQVAHAEDDPELSKNLKVTGAGYMWYLTFSQTEKNAQGGMLANANLRLAIANALDRQAIVDNFVMDGSLPTYTAVPPQFAPSATTGDDFSADQQKFADVIGFEVERAQKYFEDAKKELGKDSFEFTLIFGNNEGDEVAKVAQAIKDQLEKNLPGMTINLQNMTKTERLEKLQNDNYDIGLTRWGPDYADPMTYLNMWITDNDNNFGFWSNAEYDQLIKDCTTGAYISDYEARWNAMYEAEAIALKEAVITPLYTKANANLIATGVEGIDFHPVAINRVYKSTTIA